jgi:hypothetical protein
MYSSIIKALPDFQIALSDDKVFSEFAPIQLKNIVSELFLELKKHVSHSCQRRVDIEELKEGLI